ncbi:MAG: metallophosphoesterase family protein, partial [Ardenticatenaceae bacterium]
MRFNSNIHMRILAVSDLHTDFSHNRLLVEQLSNTLYKNDILIVAGDLSHQLKAIKETLSLLRGKFRQVFFVPGNHDFWVVNQEYNSIEKLITILKLCDSLDVQVRPAKIRDV